MSPSGAEDGDRLALAIPWRWLAGALVGMALALCALALVNHLRTQHRRDGLFASFCNGDVSERTLEDLERLVTDPAANTEAASTDLAYRFAAPHEPGLVRVFYEYDQQIWSIDPWGSHSFGQSGIPVEFEAWRTTWPLDSCHSTTRRSELLVGRRVRTPEGRAVLLLLSLQSQQQWLD